MATDKTGLFVVGGIVLAIGGALMLGRHRVTASPPVIITPPDVPTPPATPPVDPNQPGVVNTDPVTTPPAHPAARPACAIFDLSAPYKGAGPVDWSGQAIPTGYYLDRDSHQVLALPRGQFPEWSPGNIAKIADFQQWAGKSGYHWDYNPRADEVNQLWMLYVMHTYGHGLTWNTAPLAPYPGTVSYSPRFGPPSSAENIPGGGMYLGTQGGTTVVGH